MTTDTITIDIKDDEENFDIIADWKDDPATVIEQVNSAIAMFGIKFEPVETGSDNFTFKLKEEE